MIKEGSLVEWSPYERPTADAKKLRVVAKFSEGNSTYVVLRDIASFEVVEIRDVKEIEPCKKNIVLNYYALTCREEDANHGGRHHQFIKPETIKKIEVYWG